MKAKSRGSRGTWVGVALVASLAVAVLGGSSAQASSIGARSFGAGRIAAARDASASSGIVLGGFTSQQFPAFFKVSKDARTLTVGAIALSMTCTSGAQFVLPDGFNRVRISPSGKLRASVSIPPTAGSSGETFSGSDSMTAKLGSRHTQLSGTWRLHVNYSFTNGMSDQCDSGPVRFIATS